ncbi:predicted protein [Aspergillus terreus NIH2624]|uniref:Rhodopsin domain-containing protein n=1 Tax=Aspergillus terreus (strain NIH 2624 / FGSC A1156) TaxID=341663 RepID=Q0CTU6_ASPTN|nr:uncharacterized protein ATEG_02888 [Aspergillus terreus NIH2624]EAU36162.1 predicted protein [Aspergillus terreus NIH2624]
MAVLAMCGRVYSRALLSHNFGTEDVLMIIGTVLSAAHLGVSLETIHYGVGKHVEDVPDLERFTSNILKYTLASAVLFIPATGFVKASVLVFYYKTFPVRIFGIIVTLLQGIIAAYSVACIFALIFGCDPLALAWDPSIMEGYCINQFAVYYAQAALNVFTDLAIITLPIPLICGLHIRRSEKAIIFALILVSLVAVGVESARFSAIHKLQTSSDLTWATGEGIIFGQVELNVSIICGSAIVMRPFFRRYLPALFHTSRTSSEPSMITISSSLREIV